MITLFHKKFQKNIAKIKDRNLYARIKEEFDLVVKDPLRGKFLEHPFRKYKIRTVGFVYEKNAFRIAYTADPITDRLIFLLIDARENFYSKLERVL